VTERRHEPPAARRTGRIHRYAAQLVWTGNRGAGTSGYAAYDRAHEVKVADKPALSMSADPQFRGDATRYNPEELLLAALSSCHMLWYLHLAADSGIVVTSYEDHAEGVMREAADGAGAFESVTLKPRIHVAPDTDLVLATRLHETAHDKCFIARSVNFEVRCEPSVAGADESF
jgi:organic hydroperoxide reductase OsmC/OhrA